MTEPALQSEERVLDETAALEQSVTTVDPNDQSTQSENVVDLQYRDSQLPDGIITAIDDFLACSYLELKAWADLGDDADVRADFDLRPLEACLDAFVEEYKNNDPRFPNGFNGDAMPLLLADFAVREELQFRAAQIDRKIPSYVDDLAMYRGSPGDFTEACRFLLSNDWPGDPGDDAQGLVFLHRYDFYTKIGGELGLEPLYPLKKAAATAAGAAGGGGTGVVAGAAEGTVVAPGPGTAVGAAVEGTVLAGAGAATGFLLSELIDTPTASIVSSIIKVRHTFVSGHKWDDPDDFTPVTEGNFTWELNIHKLGLKGSMGAGIDVPGPITASVVLPSDEFIGARDAVLNHDTGFSKEYLPPSFFRGACFIDHGVEVRASLIGYATGGQPFLPIPGPAMFNPFMGKYLPIKTDGGTLTFGTSMVEMIGFASFEVPAPGNFFMPSQTINRSPYSAEYPEPTEEATLSARIGFPTDVVLLDYDDWRALRQIVVALAELDQEDYESCTIEVIGMHSNSGDYQHNLDLAMARANNTLAALITILQKEGLYIEFSPEALEKIRIIPARIESPPSGSKDDNSAQYRVAVVNVRCEGLKP